MTSRQTPRRPSRPMHYQVTRARDTIRRFPRAEGRFDLPVVAGRTPKQVARRLA